MADFSATGTFESAEDDGNDGIVELTFGLTALEKIVLAETPLLGLPSLVSIKARLDADDFLLLVKTGSSMSASSMLSPLLAFLMESCTLSSSIWDRKSGMSERKSLDTRPRVSLIPSRISPILDRRSKRRRLTRLVLCLLGVVSSNCMSTLPETF